MKIAFVLIAHQHPKTVERLIRLILAEGHVADLSGLTFKTDDKLDKWFFAETTSKLLLLATNGTTASLPFLTPAAATAAAVAKRCTRGPIGIAIMSCSSRSS